MDEMTGYRIDEMERCCKELEETIAELKAEQAEVVPVLNKAKYIPVALRSEIFQNYAKKIQDHSDEAGSIRKNLESLIGGCHR